MQLSQLLGHSPQFEQTFGKSKFSKGQNRFQRILKAKKHRIASKTDPKFHCSHNSPKPTSDFSGQKTYNFDRKFRFTKRLISIILWVGRLLALRQRLRTLRSHPIFKKSFYNFFQKIFFGKKKHENNLVTFARCDLPLVELQEGLSL